jgi:hypothetical protein
MCNRFDGVTVRQHQDLMAVLGLELSFSDSQTDLLSRGFLQGDAEAWFRPGTRFVRPSELLRGAKTVETCGCGCSETNAAVLRTRLRGQSRNAIEQAHLLLSESKLLVERAHRLCWDLEQRCFRGY